MSLVEPRYRGLADDLGKFGDATALVDSTGSLTYAELEARVVAAAELLGRDRKLLLLAANNSVETMVAYLAALRGRHPVILGPPGDDRGFAALAAAYDPDVVGADGQYIFRHEFSVHELHPELAVLLSTSGSTGTPKLVRLSHDNVTSNAAAIAELLEVGPDDRAITTLPLHYCYGLSVINSYLFAGASVVLSDLSVVDACFWKAAREQRVTSFAGVPHTFELLDRIGFSGAELPSLRYLTQAGGRMPAERVKRYAELGDAGGFDLVVMYGQTEATARMAYLPPELARSRPTAIGVAIPGGELRVDAPDGDGVGELVFRGANVMLGYARGPDDLAVGRTVHELHTGDLARGTTDGVFEIVGRVSRFIKPFGVRLDLDDLERVLLDDGVAALCTGDDNRLVVGVVGPPSAAGRVLDERLRLPSSHVTIVELDVLPRRPSGKPDYAAVMLAAEPQIPKPGVASVRAAFVSVLGVEPRHDDSFVTLGGDSLSYVEMSIVLEDQLGELPRNWHLMAVSTLEASSAGRTSSVWARVDTTLVMRAIAVVLIVANHSRWFRVSGGAHALLAVAGFNFARFQLTARSMLPTIARIAIPSIAIITAVAAFSDRFLWTHALLVNDFLGPDGARWSYWFVESLVQILLAVALVFAVPAVGRFERRRPMLVAYLAVAAGLCVRFNVIELTRDPAHEVWWAHEVFWLFALGWAAARAPSFRHRAFIALVAGLAMPGFFIRDARGVVVAAAIAAIALLPTVRVPRAAVPFIRPLAAASLYIYLTHIPLYHALGRTFGPVGATLGSLITGVATWLAARWIEGRWSERYGRVARADRTRNATGKMLTMSSASAGSAAAS